LFDIARRRTLQLTENIYEATRNVLKLSGAETISTIEAANKIAGKRSSDIKEINQPIKQ
jgi:leucine dehydrogenase